MTEAQNTTSTRSRRWFTRTLLASVAAGLLVAPGIARAGSGETGAQRSDRVQAMAEDMNLQRTWVEYFNGRKWDELGGIYEEDAIALPPNSEPIKGRPAIVEYFKGIRDTIGEVKCGEPARLTASADSSLVSLVAGECSAHGGTLRFNAHELYARQPDGSLRYRVDMFGMR